MARQTCSVLPCGRIRSSPSASYPQYRTVGALCCALAGERQLRTTDGSPSPLFQSSIRYQVSSQSGNLGKQRRLKFSPVGLPARSGETRGVDLYEADYFQERKG